MKLSSFRLRIALLSAALAGSALVGFGAVSWFQIYNAKISRLDAELLNHLMRATRSPDRERWQLYADSLPYAFGGGTNIKIPIALLVLDPNGNILNAIKYNLANGWIKIRTNQTPTTLHVTIANASQDIPVNECDRIFDRFYRGDPSRNRKVEGIGLGLSLAREIARAHGGDLTLDLTPFGQTAFTLTLPMKLQN